MFFAGTLQEGILKAVQEQKRVVCFVRSDNDESAEWAQDYLQPLEEILQDHAVVLELREGSTEAGYLAAICPVETTPLVVVIHNGQVKGALKPPMAVEDFRKQLLTVMDLNFRVSGPASAPAESASERSNVPQSSSNAASISTRAEATAERMRRNAEIEAEKKRKKKAADDARRQADPVANAQEAYQAKLAEEKKKQRQKEAEEKQRVLDLIEADKRERRKQAADRAAERDAQRRLAEEDAEAKPEGEDVPVQHARAGTSRASENCRLQLRLWDERTERAEFKSSQTLADVREWLDKNIEPRVGPYSLREVIGVGAARQLDIANEDETLLSLGLTPSTTLIVRPAANVASRLEEPSMKNTLIRIFIGPFLILRAFALAFWYTLMGFIQADHRKAGRPDGDSSQRDEASARASGARGPRSGIQTLDVQKRKKDKPELYNGNQLGVIPNEADDDDDDDDTK